MKSFIGSPLLCSVPLTLRFSRAPLLPRQGSEFIAVNAERDDAYE